MKRKTENKEEQRIWQMSTSCSKWLENKYRKKKSLYHMVSLMDIFSSVVELSFRYILFNGASWSGSQWITMYSQATESAAPWHRLKQKSDQSIVVLEICVRPRVIPMGVSPLRGWRDNFLVYPVWNENKQKHYVPFLYL